MRILKTVPFLLSLVLMLAVGLFLVVQAQPQPTTAAQPQFDQSMTGMPVVSGYTGPAWTADHAARALTIDIVAVSPRAPAPVSAITWSPIHNQVSMQGAQGPVTVGLPDDLLRDTRVMGTTHFQPAAANVVSSTGAGGHSSNLPDFLLLSAAGFALLGMVMKKSKHRRPWTHFTGTVSSTEHTGPIGTIDTT